MLGAHKQAGGGGARARRPTYLNLVVLLPQAVGLQLQGLALLGQPCALTMRLVQLALDLVVVVGQLLALRLDLSEEERGFCVKENVTMRSPYFSCSDLRVITKFIPVNCNNTVQTQTL